MQLLHNKEVIIILHPVKSKEDNTINQRKCYSEKKMVSKRLSLMNIDLHLKPLLFNKKVLKKVTTLAVGDGKYDFKIKYAKMLTTFFFCTYSLIAVCICCALDEIC